MHRNPKYLQMLKVLLALHFVILLLHSAAHLYHQVLPDIPGILLVVVGYYLLPAYGFIRLYSNPQKALTACMPGLSVAFIHGFLYHFVWDTPDYVCYFGAHITGLWFSLTAYSLAVVDFSAIVTITLQVIHTIRTK